MGRWLLAVVVALAAVAVCGGAGGGAARPLQIAYVSPRPDLNDPQRQDIVLIRPDGHGARRVTRGRFGAVGELAWSPDGRRMAYWGCRRASPACAFRSVAFYVSRADGGGVRRLFTGRAGLLEWSPTGRLLLYVPTPGNGSGDTLEVVDLSTGKRHRLASGAGDASWSPRGDRIAYIKGALAGDVYSVGADGRERRRLTTDGSDETPVWSPDGRRLAWVTTGGNPDLVVARVDGTGTRYVAQTAAGEFHPFWISKRLLGFTRSRGLRRPLELLVADLRTNRVRRLARGIEGSVLSPDHRVVAYVGIVGRPGNTFSRRDIYVVRVDGTGRRRLTRDGESQLPRWSPDGRLILYTNGIDQSLLRVVRSDGTGDRRLAYAEVGSGEWRP